MKARSSTDSKHINSKHSTSNGNKRRRTTTTTTKTVAATDKKSSTLPNHLLKRISNEILDHTKQLGLFDEMRLKLLANIELSKEFFSVKDDFRREVELFCSHVDLNLPRAKLRERLNARTLYKSARRLEEHVHRVSRKHRHEFKKLYNQHAIGFLKRIMNKSATIDKLD